MGCPCHWLSTPAGGKDSHKDRTLANQQFFNIRVTSSRNRPGAVIAFLSLVDNWSAARLLVIDELLLPYCITRPSTFRSTCCAMPEMRWIARSAIYKYWLIL